MTIELIRSDTGEVVWRQVVEGPGGLEVPGFGHLGAPIGVRITYNGGHVEETFP
jgi:hypothetical protein